MKKLFFAAAFLMGAPLCAVNYTTVNYTTYETGVKFTEIVRNCLCKPPCRVNSSFTHPIERNGSLEGKWRRGTCAAHKSAEEVNRYYRADTPGELKDGEQTTITLYSRLPHVSRLSEERLKRENGKYFIIIKNEATYHHAYIN